LGLQGRVEVQGLDSSTITVGAAGAGGIGGSRGGVSGNAGATGIAEALKAF